MEVNYSVIERDDTSTSGFVIRERKKVKIFDLVKEKPQLSIIYERSPSPCPCDSPECRAEYEKERLLYEAKTGK